MTKTTLIKILKATLLYSVIYTTYRCLNLPCPIKKLLNFPCPTCGVTHALEKLIQLDIKQSLGYNFLAIPFTLLFIYIIYKETTSTSDEKSNKIILYSTITLFLLYILKNLLY
ncbi:MAG: DUF2752 domain-containing protein [Synergistaceae bacterium]